MNKALAGEGESASALIDQKLAALGDWRGETLARMRKLIHEADPRAPLGDGGPEADALQVPHCIGRDVDPRPDLAERRRLLVDGNRDPLGDERIGGEQAADAAADDDDCWTRCHAG